MHGILDNIRAMCLHVSVYVNRFRLVNLENANCNVDLPCSLGFCTQGVSVSDS